MKTTGAWLRCRLDSVPPASSAMAQRHMLQRLEGMTRPTLQRGSHAWKTRVQLCNDYRNNSHTNSNKEGGLSGSQRAADLLVVVLLQVVGVPNLQRAPRGCEDP